MTHKQKAVAVQEMLSTNGWEVIEKELTEELNSLMAKLVESNDEGIRGEIKGIKKLIDKIRMYENVRV
jgi:hypothetical protein